ncbi:MAG: hypothetical protein GX591_11405 [Planctomycetes bacterium]|nr:hypothetical protein [Planctomycetota bacterium]
MPSDSSSPRSYVGFGFGAIQVGLFLYEAQHSGAFGRLAVAEVMAERVAQVRRAGGCVGLNIAHADCVERTRVGPVEILDTASDDDVRRLADLLAEATDIGTAVPGVSCYADGGQRSLAALLAAGLARKTERGGPPAVVYAAENHNHAAEILEAHVLAALEPRRRDAVRRRVRFVNTVIGKMSGVVTDPQTIGRQGLVPMTGEGDAALLVEAFNRILISRVDADGAAGPLRCGFPPFEEKADLLPFEEAKLYGHNATHALAAAVGALLGLERICQLPEVPGAMTFLRDAFLRESGASLVRKHRSVDPLFTARGYRRYADDLLERMVNPLLGDTVARVGRSPERKLGWDDRFIGTIRLATAQRIQPRRYAFGAAATAAQLDAALLADGASAADLLAHLWSAADAPPDERAAAVAHVDRGLSRLRAWLRAGRPPLEECFR